MSDGKIIFECPFCNKRSKVPATFAGKKGKCPGCNQVIEVPDPDADTDADYDDGGQAPAPRERGGGRRRRDHDDGDDVGGNEKTCPMCGETIKRVAKKCKHCGSFLDQRLKRRRSAGARHQDNKASEPPSAFDWVLVVLCWPIACLIGLIAVIQGYHKRGALMIVVSIVWGTIFRVFVMMATGQIR